MSDAIFNELRELVKQGNDSQATDRLCQWLKDRKDFHSLFYALLLKKRRALGVSPVPTASANDLTSEQQGALEEGIREAARQVGQLCLEAGNIPQAWIFFRMLADSAPVRAALEAYAPGPEEDIQPLVQIAFYEGVHPTKGFDWILERYGLCNSITNMSSPELPISADDRRYCIKRLVRSLHRELVDRLANDIERREGQAPREKNLAQPVLRMMENRPWLFEDEFAHIDVSHLASVVQMSTSLEPCEELDLARNMCIYGDRLSPRLKFKNEPPFEGQYKDYGIYLDILAGHKVEEGLAHFRRKVAEMNAEEIGTFPAEVLVNLLLRLNRPAEALAMARVHLAKVENRQLSCTSLVELCQKAGDYQALAELAEEQTDAVHFMAGLLESRQNTAPR